MLKDNYIAALVGVRGQLGFTRIAVKDTHTGITQTTFYHVDFPYIGMVASQTMVYPTTGATLSSVTNTVGKNTDCYQSYSAPGSGINLVCLLQSDRTGHDLNGSTLPSVTAKYRDGSNHGTYDAYGNPLVLYATTTDPLTSATSSVTTTNSYNNNTTNWFIGQLTGSDVNSIVGSSNLTRHSLFCYDSANLLNKEIIEPGSLTCTSGSVGTYTLVNTYSFDSFGNRVTATVSGGGGLTSRTSSAGFDSAGEFQRSAANALSQTENFTYNASFGAVTTRTDLNGLVTSWSQDSFGRTKLETRPDGTKTTFDYDYCAGAVTCPTYGQYRLQSRLVASDGATQIGPVTSIYYDALSRVIATDTQGFDGSTIRVATVYDAYGRVQQTSRPYFVDIASPKWTQFAYDDLGRVTQATFPDSSHTTYGFNGLTTTVTNNLSQTTTTVKNAQGLNATVTDTTSHSTSYVYDAFGDLITVTDANGNVIRNTFDVRGNKVVSQDPDMGIWTYAYDVLGELTSQTDAKNQTTTLTYDVLGRPLTRTEAGLYSAWTYGTSGANHNVGQVIEAKACPTSACASIVTDKTYLFDGLGRESRFYLQTATDIFGYTTTYNTNNGQIASITYPSGYTVDRSYNATGFLTHLTEAGNVPVWTIISRDAELHITAQTAGNNVTTSQSFDPNTGLIQYQRAGSGSVASFDYAFDTIGNLTSRTDNSQPYTERFCYDSLNRLTNYNIGAACTGGTTVAYDAIGNITTKTATGTYSYGGLRPHAVASITGTVDGLTNPNYTYDANGNLTCTSSGGGCSGTIGRNVNLTSFNMAASILQGTNSLALTYDDQLHRVQQVNTVSSTSTTRTVYINDAASGAMSERVTTSATTPTVWNSFTWNAAPWGGTTANALPTFTDYITIDGQVVAQRKVTYPLASAWGMQNWNGFTWGAPAGSVWGSAAGTNPPRFKWGTDPWSGNVVAWNYFNLDHLGSVAVITDQGGNVAPRLSYDAWGKQRNPNGTDASCGSISAPTTRGFTNEEEVAATCGVNLNARLYDPIIGKFIAPDPLGIDGGSNVYAYVGNRPTVLTDPSGMAAPFCQTMGDSPNSCGANVAEVCPIGECGTVIGYRPYKGSFGINPFSFGVSGRGGGIDPPPAPKQITIASPVIGPANPSIGTNNNQQIAAGPSICELRDWHNMNAAAKVGALRDAGFQVATEVRIRLSINPSGYAVADYIVRLPSTQPGLTVYQLGEVKTGGGGLSTRQSQNYGNGMAQILSNNAGALGLDYGDVIPVIFLGVDRFPGCPVGRG